MKENGAVRSFVQTSLRDAVALAMIYARHVQTAFLRHPPDKFELIAYIEAAHTSIGTIEAIYISNIEILEKERDDLSVFISRFKNFLDEARNNTLMDKPHQWTEIEYENLLHFYDNSVLCPRPYSSDMMLKMI